MMQSNLQIVKPLMRLLLKKLSDLGLHCFLWPNCPKTKDQYGTEHIKDITTFLTDKFNGGQQKQDISPVMR